MADYENIENLSPKEIMDLYDDILYINTSDLLASTCYISCVCLNGYATNARDWVGTVSGYVKSGYTFYNPDGSPHCANDICRGVGSSFRCIIYPYCW